MLTIYRFIGITFCFRLKQPKSKFIYHFPIDLGPNGIPFDSKTKNHKLISKMVKSKSIGKWKIQSDFG